MIFALAGNQNCGKTTLFNQLTGSNQHVGNFPGVTVDQKSGPVRGQKDCTVVDLPGIYSLRPYTAEEIVTRDFILKSKPDGIINIVDATNLERNLYLTLQLLTLRVPTVLALNMMDEVRGNGGTINITPYKTIMVFMHRQITIVMLNTLLFKTTAIALHVGHSPQGLPSTGCSQLTAFANILATDVLPVPLVPQNRYAWPILSALI